MRTLDTNYCLQYNRILSYGIPEFYEYDALFDIKHKDYETITNQKMQMRIPSEKLIMITRLYYRITSDTHTSTLTILSKFKKKRRLTLVRRFDNAITDT